jgi:PAS domain S-box-containing protein
MAGTLKENLWKLSGEGFVLTDTDGFIFEANPSFCRLIGIEALKITGKNIFDFLKIISKTK